MATNDKNTNNDQLSDLIDSAEDKQKMEPEITTINLPDVDDIPGQQDIVPAPLGEMADTTVSSADEEGDNIFNDNIDEDIDAQGDSDVTPAEKEALRKSANDMPGDDENLREAALDHTDEDGTPLNEGSFKNDVSGSDLDVPGAELDDDNETLGEEDEENNEYSLGGDNDDIPEDDL